MPELEKINEIMAEILAKHTGRKAEEITPATTLESLQIDSVNIIEIIFDVEERFDVSLPDDSIARLSTANSVNDLIELARSVIGNGR
jgi:acyl carrier protein